MKTAIFSLIAVVCAVLNAAPIETPTDLPERQNLADRATQEVRDIRQAVDLRARAASQAEAFQYQEIYNALARCDELLAEFRIAPEHERARLWNRFTQAREDLLRTQRELQDRGALPKESSRILK